MDKMGWRGIEILSEAIVKDIKKKKAGILLNNKQEINKKYSTQGLKKCILNSAGYY